MERFIIKKRTALDGLEWYCIWDNLENHWSTYVFHGKYKRKRDARYALDKSLQYIKR